jgi:SAF domain-containing protein
MHVLARVRLVVARHPWTYWLVVALVAGAAGFGVMGAMARVDAARRSWGDSTTVWVASIPIEPGEPINADRREVPRAVVPDAAIGEPPSGAVARQRIGPGEIITDSDIAAGGRASLVPAGWVAFAVPASVEHFATGDHLNVYSGNQLVASGLVVDHGESELMVAIPAEAAPALATALLTDAVTLGLTSGP